MTGILLYGDPHGKWEDLLAAVETDVPDHIVLLGDMDLDVPLDEKLRPVTKKGVSISWIAGNHDGDDVNWHDRLFESELADGNLNARVVDLGETRVAGLAGVFRGKIWNPNSQDEPRFPDRRSYIQQVPKSQRWRGGVPTRHRVTIFPEDVEALRKKRADVLVTHEAPSCHRNGFRVIDDLAAQMGASLVVHGHHHERYEAETVTGIPVIGLAEAEVFRYEPPIPAPTAK